MINNPHPNYNIALLVKEELTDDAKAAYKLFVVVIDNEFPLKVADVIIFF